MAIKTDFVSDSAFLFVDTSYLVYAMAYRTLNIYKSHYDLPSDGEELYKIDFSLDEDFVSIFRKNFISVIKKMHASHQTNPRMTLFALDCHKKDIWRRSHFEEYKLHRMVQVGPPSGLNAGPIFRYVTNSFLPSLEAQNFGHVIYHDFAEADDVIACVHTVIRQKEAERKIKILASDHDLLQLIDQHTDIYDTQGNSMRAKSIGSQKKDLMLKILIGDGSDGIPSCFVKTKGDKLLSRGFGHKAALILIENRELLRKKLIEYPSALQQFKLNSQIVDFSNIPTNIREGIAELAIAKFYG